LSWGNYQRLCAGYQRKDINDYRKVRMIIAAQIGEKDPRRVFELPGDFDHLEVMTQEQIDAHCKKFGLDKILDRCN